MAKLQNSIGNRSATYVNSQTGTTYTLNASDNGKTVYLDNASAITLTLPNSLLADFQCTIVQLNTGQVTITAGSGATVNNYDNHTKTAGRYAMVSILVISNSNGTSAIYITQGRTAA